ncbi:MAG TPA: hypothetical protein VFO10_01960 [Oligoflexus sp.]|uniref:hypothetical protein n=1 Tax=Oligoflexus sp. TaxID=1971216 RepID=UPI002D7F3414|nr:hypothetical protein [Oligoflexus sp.]HET9235983.1 hypothetical protein [Oligoflexus sp.]
MTCRTLLALISAAMVWNLPNITLAQAMQGDSEQSLDPATNAKEVENETDAVLQMQAKKPPVKAKKGAAPTKAGKGKVPPKPAAKPAPKLIPKPGKPASRPAPKQTPFFPPAPPTQLDPVDNSRFQVPMPEEKGDLNIWGEDTTTAPAGASAEFRNQFGLIGAGNFMGFGFGLEYLRRSTSWLDWGLQLTSTQTRLTNSKNPETDEFLAPEMNAARVSLRLFNRRWLYFGTGLSLAMIQGSYGWEGSGVVDEEISSEFKAQLVVLDFVLGSQWEFGSRFYVAVDWLGFGIPLAGSLNYTENSDLDDLTRILSGSNTDERVQKELGAQFRPYYGLLKFGIML